MAKLEFRYGAMNSGKSAALSMTANNYREQGGDVFIMKPAVDSKGDDKIVSRTGLELRVDVLVPPSMNVLEEVLAAHALREFDAVLTDESQFFTPDQITDFQRVAKLGQVPVIAFGIRTDFLNRGFPGSSRLLEIADTNTELPTICTCRKRKARMNARKVNGKYVFDGDQVAIEGKDNVKYDALCAECYFKQQALAA